MKEDYSDKTADTEPGQPVDHPEPVPIKPQGSQGAPTNIVQNVLYLVIVLVIGGVLLWLIGGQGQPLSTAQAEPTPTPVPPSPTVTRLPQPTDTPLPVATPWPTSDAVPVVTEPYPIFLVTPIPGPTYTPTPEVVEAAVAPAIKVVDYQQLPLHQLRSLSSMTDEDVSAYALFEAVGWTEQGEVVLQERNLIERDGAYFPGSLYQVAGTWAISPNDGEVASLTNWRPSTVVVEGFMDSVVKGPMWVIHGYNNEGSSAIDWSTIPTWTPTQQQLANEWAAKKPITFPQYWYVSPDGETVILRIVTDKIYIFKPGQTEPAVILPKGDNRYESAAKPRLSPDGQKIVYGVRIDNPEVNDGYGRETDTYEIQISSLDGSDVVTIKPAYEFSNPGGFTWSADNQFIAFTAQPEEYTDGHIYIARSDGSAVTDITPADFKLASSLYWSPDGLRLLFIGGNPEHPETVGYWIMTLIDQ